MSQLESFARNATKEYLQHVVFVDDDLYEKTPEKPVDVIEVLAPLKSQFTTAKSTPEEAITQPTKPQFHPRQLVESFAKEGMICALYEPQEGFDCGITSDLFKLCDRADAVILDWDLYNDDGRNIIPLIINLVNISLRSMPYHAKLCVIYTAKQDLGRVANYIYESIEKDEIKIDDVSSKLHLTVGATHIIILGKPGIRRTDEFQPFEVTEEQLAKRIIDEFSAMHKGILSSYVIYALASVRKNSKRILDKFNANLDAPFILQRALSLENNEDSFDHLPELIAEELFSIMLDESIPVSDLNSITKEAIDKFNLGTINFLKSNNSAINPSDYAKLFLNGHPNISFPKEKINRKITEFHSALGCIDSSEKKLASLLCLRTRYCTITPPALEFGTIVHIDATQPSATARYAVCIMPACDCVRLTEQTTFPFWDLLPNPGSHSIGLTIPTNNQEFIELFLYGPPKKRLWLEKFSPCEKGIVQAQGEHPDFYFQGADDNRVRLKWVCQLKPSHAQRIAHNIGQVFSRVGVNEAEWLRLRAAGSSQR